MVTLIVPDIISPYSKVSNSMDRKRKVGRRTVRVYHRPPLQGQRTNSTLRLPHHCKNYLQESYILFLLRTGITFTRHFVLNLLLPREDSRDRVPIGIWKGNILHKTLRTVEKDLIKTFLTGFPHGKLVRNTDSESALPLNLLQIPRWIFLIFAGWTLVGWLV